MSRRYEKTTNSIMREVDRLAIVVKEISDKLVDEYLSSLDKEMSTIQAMLEQGDLTTDQIEVEILHLANQLYFAGVAQEDLGIKEDTCKAIRIELYNKAREDSRGTVADKNAKAEMAVQQESTVLAIYSRAYKKVKLRVDAGYEMLNSLKKIMNKRISEMELSKSRYIGGSEDAG